jgi:hypothetical protein
MNYMYHQNKCEICGKSKNKGRHISCSKLKQARYAALKREAKEDRTEVQIRDEHENYNNEKLKMKLV